MRARVQAGGGEPFGGQARQPRAGVVQDQRTFGQPGGRQPGWRLPGRGQEGQHRIAPPGPQHSGRPWAAGAAPPGPRPACRQPAAARSPARSARPPAHRCGVVARQRVPAPAAAGGRWPRWTRPASRGPPAPGPGALQRRPAPGWRRPAGGAAAGVSPMAVGRTCRARAREQRRAYLRLQVGHVQADGGRRQVQARAALAKEPGRRWRPGAQPVQADFRMTDPYSEKLNQAVMIFDFDNRGAWPKMDAITPTRG